MSTYSNKNIIINLSILLALLLTSVFSIQSRKESMETKCPASVNKFDCWRSLLNKTLERDGLAQSFEVLSVLYDTEPKFAAECHGFTHELGEKSYGIFNKKGVMSMTPKASYCGYGFYHGFMEALLHSGEGIDKAKEFCDDVDKQLSFFGGKTILACYHGIGHGAVDGSDPAFFGSPQKLIGPGLSICKTISSIASEVHQCGTGVFNALALAQNSKSFGVDLSDNPYDICLDQDEVFKKSCYEQMNTRASHMSKGNFPVASKFLNKIPEEKYAIYAMEQLAPSLIASKVGQGSSYVSEVQTCRLVPVHLKMPCLKGLVGGILEFGKPDFEYIEAIDFCNSLDKATLEKKNCFERLNSSLVVLYSKEKALEICAKIDSEYRRSCKV